MQNSKLISELENSQSTLKLDQDDGGEQRSVDELYLVEIQERQDWKPSMDWLSRFQPYSRLLMAAIDPDTWTLRSHVLSSFGCVLNNCVFPALSRRLMSSASWI